MIADREANWNWLQKWSGTAIDTGGWLGRGAIIGIVLLGPSYRASMTMGLDY